MRPVREVRVWSRSHEHAKTFAATAAASHGIVVTAVASAQEAVSAADLVCTTTAAVEPVLAPAKRLRRMSAFGYKQTSSSYLGNVRFTPESRHSEAQER